MGGQGGNTLTRPAGRGEGGRGDMMGRAVEVSMSMRTRYWRRRQVPALQQRAAPLRARTRTLKHAAVVVAACKCADRHDLGDGAEAEDIRVVQP